jgi:MinD-like ATPase involved in chromosome partitioning or flagellar assembly
MHTVTFYSFKGGVGRSLALANVAHELARSGERVLVVDFDLEAPGLDTLFDSSAGRTPGIVEFVGDYLERETPPDALDYVQEVTRLSDSGPIFLMPAGVQDETYARRLSSIDWVELYERYDGYLMFEDLKAQWAKKLDVSYVLIDSRTGHTDVGGICTRQLPDAVVAVFFPNQQNLQGLSKVVEAVRSEPEVTGRDSIDLIFVASDVPRLDDEERILERTMLAFTSKLKIRQPVHLVHHYDSLSLLERPVFTKDRPNTRLALEYVELARRIRVTNVADREGVLWQLRHGPLVIDDAPDRFFTKLSRIEAVHSADGEVLYELARVRSAFGQIVEATSLLEEAIATYGQPEVWLTLAENYQRQGEKSKAAHAAASVFSDSSAELKVLHRAVELLRLTDPHRLQSIGQTPAIRGLELQDQISLAILLDRSIEERQAATQILEPLIRRAVGNESWYGQLVYAASMALLPVGKFHEARRLLVERAKEAPNELHTLFNLAMAEWAVTSEVSPDVFARVLELSDPAFPRAPNYWQCMAVAHNALGRHEEALRALDQARASSQQRSAPEFSCWSYLSVAPSEFRKDLDRIERWIRDPTALPRFLHARAQLELSSFETSSQE